MMYAAFKGIPSNIYYEPIIHDSISDNHLTAFMVTVPYNQINYKYITRHLFLAGPNQLRWFV